MIALEMVKDRHTKAPATDETKKILASCYEKGLILLSCGVSTVRFMPPLCVTEDELRRICDVLRRSVMEVLM